MANWNGGILTNKGRALVAKVEAGTCKLALTKMKVGDGSPGSVETLTDLVAPKQTISLSAIIPAADGTCDVSGVLTNATLEKGFYLRELGLFATDPDEGEILYAVSTDTTPDYLQAKGGATSLALDVHMKIAIASASSISVEGKMEGLITAEQLKAHNASETAHENRLKVAPTSSKPASMADKGLWLEILEE